MIHFYNSEESYVIAEFIALGFFWDIFFANFMMSRIVVNSIIVSGSIFFYEK